MDCLLYFGGLIGIILIRLGIIKDPEEERERETPRNKYKREIRSICHMLENSDGSDEIQNECYKRLKIVSEVFREFNKQPS